MGSHLGLPDVLCQQGRRPPGHAQCEVHQYKHVIHVLTLFFNSKCPGDGLKCIQSHLGIPEVLRQQGRRRPGHAKYEIHQNKHVIHVLTLFFH